MKVDKEEVEHVAMLARIELSKEEKESYSEQLSEILEFFDRLIVLKVLPTPKEYFVTWPDLTIRTDDERASVALKIIQTFKEYAVNDLEVYLPPIYFFMNVLDMTQEEAEALVKAAQDFANDNPRPDDDLEDDGTEESGGNQRPRGNPVRADQDA